MRYHPESFQDLTLKTSEANACSPEDPGPKWRGITITAPSKVTINKASTEELAIPICGFYQVELLSLMDGQPMQVQVHKLRSSTRYKEALLEKDASPEEPPPMPHEEVNPNIPCDMLAASHFNHNLCEYVPLPRASATYLIHVEYAGMQSNEVTVEVIFEFE